MPKKKYISSLFILLLIISFSCGSNKNNEDDNTVDTIIVVDNNNVERIKAMNNTLSDLEQHLDSIKNDKNSLAIDTLKVDIRILKGKLQIVDLKESDFLKHQKQITEIDSVLKTLYEK